MRGGTLQRFIDLTEQAISVRAPECAGAGPAAGRIFAALRARSGSPGTSAPQSQPVTVELPAALRLAQLADAPVPELARTLAALAGDLRWAPRKGSESDPVFHFKHANAMVVGPGGLEEREDVWIGITLMAPETLYPNHRHPPEEVYVALTDGGWWKEGHDWSWPGPGGLIYNEPGITHAMQSRKDPMLAIWSLWVG